ncbi:hypothetical protein N7532_010416 [Penicillium argentinense]|uniref:Uncharacterized protein n=1 Tax=Penicillium argentinense TaxID=1131581 RepID=A0A9W9EPS9_9EURO|nr:uncharacterized protein N7532_010416 [Penicillium argentinense]KAJ5085645.1 hypothetical protein N7532_010416 [Penicillium argentinense]
MGNTFSSPTKDETRPANRLSKPLTKRLAALSSPVQTDAPEFGSGLIGWQNPWVGSHISQDVKNRYPKAREIPPTVFESVPDLPEHLVEDIAETPQSANGPDGDALSPRSGSLSASASVRRASYQAGTLAAASDSSLVPEQPKRANSIQTPLQRHRSAIYGDKAHEATSSNTHFMVGNQRFSLSRRRSLLTRPGVATRRTTGNMRRVPSPIGEPEGPTDDLSEPPVLQWPLPPLQRPSPPVSTPMRPTSPADPRYTQLGALKLGSLRVVNGSASPCPSERIPLGPPQVAESGLGLDRLETLRPQGSTLEIPAMPDLKKSDDVPGSPFSFEKSPTISVAPRQKTIFPGELEDEGIVICDEGLTHSEKNQDSMGTVIDRSTSRSLNKTDSGYSSATSIHSVQRSRTRASFDSQSSGSGIADTTNSIRITSEQSQAMADQDIQRRFSLKEVKVGNFSRLYPNSSRWYDSSVATSAQSAGPRARRSTLCAPRNTEYPVQNGHVSYGYQSFMAGSSYTFVSDDEPPVSTRGALYGDQFSTSTLNVVHDTGSTATLEALDPSRQVRSTRSSLEVDQAISGHRSGKHGSAASHSRSRSRSKPGHQVWRHNSVIEIPQLPTILSPGHLAHEFDKETESPPTSEPHRGRPRSRSHDFRRRKLIKAHPQLDVHMTTSPYAL